MRVFDVNTGAEVLRVAQHSDWVHAVAFSPDGRWLATGSADRTFRLWDPRSRSSKRPLRASGHTKYSPVKMLRFAWTAVTSFSAFPLRLSMTAGSILSCAGFLYLLRIVYLALFTHTLVPGWASVVALQCAFSGIILLALGVAGDYIARSYEEAKVRPLYVVADDCNVGPLRKEHIG